MSKRPAEEQTKPEGKRREAASEEQGAAQGKGSQTEGPPGGVSRRGVFTIGLEFYHVQNLLLRLLRGLGGEDWAKFRHRLLLSSPSSLEEEEAAASAKPLLELLLRHYGLFGALEVAEEALKAIGLHGRADWLHLAVLGFEPAECLAWTLRRLEATQAEWLRQKLGAFGGEEDARLEMAAKALEGIGQQDPASWLRLCAEERAAWKRLEDALTRLEGDELEEFRRGLRQFPLQEGVERIPEAWIARHGARQLSQGMFRYYGRRAALEMAAETLRTVGRGPLADGLFPFPSGRDTDLADIFNPELCESLSSSLVREERSREEAHFMCSKCGSENFSERIRPDVVRDSQKEHDTYRFCPAEAGAFHCCFTGLVFEVKGAVTITYHFDSWKTHRDAMNTQNLMIAGPLLNIQAEPIEAVAAVHFPHFLCLAGEDNSQVLIVRFVEEGMRLEKPDIVGPFHAVLKNPTFSPLGVILKWVLSKTKIKLHAMTLLYQELEISIPKFHLYLLPNDSSIKKSVDECERMCPSRRMLKPPGVLKPVQIGSRFILRELEKVKICPKEIEFQYLDADREQQYLEVYAQHMKDELLLQLMEKDEDELVWEAYIRREELKSYALKPQVLNPAEEMLPRVGPEQHFVERHRNELIERTNNVEGILDVLLQEKIVDKQQYQKIVTNRTNTDKMRELYMQISGWNSFCKDKFFEALKNKQPFLIEDLEGK